MAPAVKERFARDENTLIIAVSVLLAITVATAMYAGFFNRRSIAIDEFLRGKPFSDTVAGGSSVSRWERTDSSWRFHYWQNRGFAFPFAGGGLRFDTASDSRDLRNLQQFDRIRFRFRHIHNGSALLRVFVEDTRIRKGQPLLVPNQTQFRPSEAWAEHALELKNLQVPSWFVAQNDLEQSEQGVQLSDVHTIHFVTPDIISSGDSGIMEVSDVRLEGRGIPPMQLAMGLQVLWIGGGLLFLLGRLWSWKGRALRAVDRATSAEELARTKSDFLAIMSHEIRTPLNGVIVPAQLLRDSKLDSDQTEHVETILESGNHLAAILQDALDYSKIEAGKLELEHVPFSVERALVSVKRIFEPKAREKGLVLGTWLDPELPSAVLGDPLRLRQVLMNLVSNAIKFTEHGAIRVEAKRAPRSGAASTEIDITFRVSDSGIGMDPALSRRLFQKYTQLESSTSRRFGGTGLGLSISQGLVQAMGGRIELESAVGKGSSFFFTISVDPAEVDHVEETNFFPTFEALKTRVLVADDNRVNLKVADAMLVKLGCEVTLASSGKQAIAILESSPFDLILMDCHMPEMDGFDASRTIRSWNSETDEIKRSASTTPIVALTADVLPGIRERCLDAKMNGMISKPFRQEELAKEIARWIGSGQ